MKYILQLLCFAFMFGVYLTFEDLRIFMPKQKLPPTECPPNEVFKICLSNCSNCEQRGFCILRECKRNGCDCLPHFVRVTPDGPCEPISKCPQTQCEENEVFRECGPMCERCDTFNCKMVHCEHRCYCKEGYKRDEDGKCISADKCPPKKRCAREEELRDSGYEDEYCLHQDGDEVSNSTVNITQCYCKEGFKRNGLGHCIDKKWCPIVKCMGIETYQSCPRKCNVTCRTYGDPDCEEDGHCYPGCFCPEGFYMNDFRICVPLEKCPPGSNPYIPTTLPPEETTISSSVSEELQQNETTTPSAGESDEDSEKPTTSDAEAVAVAEAEGDELPENLHDEDIVPGEETEGGTESSADTTSSPGGKSSKRPHSSKSHERSQKAESSAAASAENGAAASAESGAAAKSESDASAKSESDASAKSESGASAKSESEATAEAETEAALEALSKADVEEK